MAHRKTAIAVPEDILDEVDRAVRARRDAEITRRLDALFADESLAKRHRREADDLAELAVDWSDERW
ncbi:MAG: hypothetical protein E6J79_20110 [Deltaproteobacteria bacterium]|nr:MAG: hypothetical protein E6J79_20110 [Deltaproteobacteria bacterium]